MASGRRLPLAALAFSIGCGGSVAPDAAPADGGNDGSGDAAEAADADVAEVEVSDSGDDGDGALCDAPPSPRAIDCVAAACAPLSIAGDAIGGVAFYGIADPSVRKDPSSARLWLGYSYPRDVVVKDASGASISMVQVETHLAASDDGGASWSFVERLFPNLGPLPEPGGSGAIGYVDSETVDLAPAVIGGTTSWYSVRLAYFVEAKSNYTPRVRSFMARIGHAASPPALAAAKEQVLGLTRSGSHRLWR